MDACLEKLSKIDEIVEGIRAAANTPLPPKRYAKKKRVMSVATRKRMSAAQKKRWKAQKRSA